MSTQSKYIVLAAICLCSVLSIAQEKPKDQTPAKAPSAMDCCGSGASKMKMDCCTSMGGKETMNMSADPVKAWNAVCPVLGNKVSATTTSVKYKGKVIGFCCPDCIAKFKADPEKYMKRLNKDGSGIDEKS
jgi:YHS domain-containing protein